MTTKLIYVLTLVLCVSVAYSQNGNSSLSNETKLFIQDVHWSADGNYILFSALIGKSDWSDFKPENWGLYEAYVPTKNIVKIASASEFGSYSPGRKQIAYSSYIDGTWKIVFRMSEQEKKQSSPIIPVITDPLHFLLMEPSLFS